MRATIESASSDRSMSVAGSQAQRPLAPGAWPESAETGEIHLGSFWFGSCSRRRSRASSSCGVSADARRPPVGRPVPGAPQRAIGAVRVVVRLADLGDRPGVEESTGQEDLPLALGGRRRGIFGGVSAFRLVRLRPGATKPGGMPTGRRRGWRRRASTARREYGREVQGRRRGLK